MHAYNFDVIKEAGNEAIVSDFPDGEQAQEPSMAELLEESMPIRALRRGDVVDGKVMRADPEGLLVSIGHKMEGFIPLSEMRSVGGSDVQTRYAVGSDALVYVVDTSGTDGQAVLSIDKARGEESWVVLQQHAETGEVVHAKITGYNRGGAVVDVDGLQAFVPLSQVVLPAGVADPEEALAQRVGEELSLKVLEVNRRRNRAVLSERAVYREQREGRKERLLEELEEGETRKGVVTGTSSFGAFVDLGGADGLIHISELSWAPVAAVEEVVKRGQEVEVYVLRVDRDNRRIALSLRRLTPTPWDEVADKFELGQLVSGTITKLMDFGAFARIEESIEGLVHVSELSDRHITHPKEVVGVGDILTLKIVSMDLERHRMGLSLKQVEESERAEPVETML
jgi:small subunit ribosomal protein S1